MESTATDALDPRMYEFGKKVEAWCVVNGWARESNSIIVQGENTVLLRCSLTGRNFDVVWHRHEIEANAGRECLLVSSRMSNLRTAIMTDYFPGQEEA